VAAKKMYFGVGGGVDDFIGEVGRRRVGVKVVWDSNDNSNIGGGGGGFGGEATGAGGAGGGGVGRVILQVTLSDATIEGDSLT